MGDATTPQWKKTGLGRSVFRPDGQPAPRPVGGFAGMTVSLEALRRVLGGPEHEMLMDLSRRRLGSVGLRPPAEPVVDSVDSYRQIRIDVTNLDPDPATAHAKIIKHAWVMISDPTGEIAAAYPNGLTADPDQLLRGLVGILERHYPLRDSPTSARCAHCPDDGNDRWPCEDYLDAARGLVTGLPGGQIASGLGRAGRASDG